MKYILGIDQGGTKTAAAIIDENGNLSGTGFAGGAYFPHQTIPHALSEMERAASAALAQAHLTISAVDRIIAGVTGVDYPGDEAAIGDALRKSFGTKEIHVYNDTVIALHSGTSERYGTVICIGTGINAAIRRENGDCFVFGDYLGEELQGGSALARLGARTVFDTNLGIRHAEKLTELFLHFSGTDTVDELLQKYMQDAHFQKRLKLIVPEMIGLAARGDAETTRLLFDFAEKISVYIKAGLKNASLLSEPFRIVLTGGVLKGKHNPLAEHLTQLLQSAAPKATILNAKYEPVVGACVMGLLQFKSFTEKMEQNLAESAEKMSLLR